MKSWYRSWPVVGFAVGMLMIVLACGGGAAAPTLVATSPAQGDQSAPVSQATAVTDVVQPTSQATAVADAAQPQVFNIGDVIGIDGLNLIVLGWQVVEGNSFAQPDPGQRFIAVEMVIVNQGDSPKSVSGVWQLSLKDAEFRKYTPDFSATVAIGDRQLGGVLVPGERLRGWTGFSIPEDARGLTLTFDSNLLSGGTVSVVLGDDPVSQEPPATNPGEQPIPVFNVGESVQVGDLVVTVNEVTSPPGDRFSQPDDGYRFVLVDVTIENRGDRSRFLSSIQTSIKDAQGYRYTGDITATSLATGGRIDGELPAGQTVRGQIGFEVPADASELRFVFDPDLIGGTPVSIRLP
ncbi:DUF4352 domain-containing protein [Chloroflexus sp.]|uniref:DUF4352 domain-containing protein n=1 Tax=Chloroflexus sp. TaxID=1904827 RepID=UPI002ADD8D7C|nr:DUF4352 domain-containing protein [Chloroflexus sp.]